MPRKRKGEKRRKVNHLPSPHRLRDTFVAACVEAGVGMVEIKASTTRSPPTPTTSPRATTDRRSSTYARAWRRSRRSSCARMEGAAGTIRPTSTGHYTSHA